jgi:hypothetical protein
MRHVGLPRTGLLLLAKSENLKDALEVSLEAGQVKIFMQIGHYEKVSFIFDLVDP